MSEINEVVPTLKRYLNVVQIAGDEVQIRDGGAELIYFRGKSIPVVLKMFAYLDGKRTGKDIIDLMEKDGIGPDITSNMLETFLKKGILEDLQNKSLVETPEKSKIENILTFLSRFTPDKYGYYTVLKDKNILVVGINNLGVEVVKNLILMGMPRIYVVMEDNEGSNFLKEEIEFNLNRENIKTEVKYFIDKSLSIEFIKRVLEEVTFDTVFVPLNPQLNIELYKEMNRVFVEENISWLSAHIVRTNVQIGPLIVPGLTACHRCYDARKKSNMEQYKAYMDYENSIDKNKTGNKGNEDDFILCATIGASLVVFEILKLFLQFKTPSTYGAVLDIDLSDYKIDYHYILKLPRCPVCGVKNQMKSPFQYSKEDNIVEEFAVKSLK